MPKFVKNPIEVEAFQLTASTSVDYLENMGILPTPYMHGYFTIPTVQGPVQASYGDWIITGTDGEVYPCNDEIFRKNFTPAGD